MVADISKLVRVESFKSRPHILDTIMFPSVVNESPGSSGRGQKPSTWGPDDAVGAVLDRTEYRRAVWRQWSADQHDLEGVPTAVNSF